MDLKFVFVASFLILGAAVTIVLSDSAHCKIKWMFSIPCERVQDTLVNQIKEWQISTSCQYTGEKCSYELVSSIPYLLKATHTAPDSKKVSDLSFLLEQSITCKVTGEAIHDSASNPSIESTNFCALQNLINGSNLVTAEGYHQFSNKWICPGFDTANCTIA